MSSSAKVQATHLERQAVVYLRQSSPKQVLEHQESARNQRALQQRLLDLGWKKGQVAVIDEDQGLSAKHASSREGFQRLVADVGLRKVGIVMGYEVSRLSRNCADWHRLLELCALFDTLIGDTDGIYNPREFNDRLLLGLKGTMSEAELHSLRLRLDAGRLSKVRRGELIQHLPTGYLRTSEGLVVLDPNAAIQDRLRLVFDQFRELGSVQKVLHFLVKHRLQLPRRQVSGLYSGDLLWKDASAAALLSILKNPAYAGAFAYGRRIVDPTRQVPGRPSTGRKRRPRQEWLALVPNAYPAYISWTEYEQNQRTLAGNAQRIQERFVRKLALRKGAALLAGLVRCGVCGHHMRVSYKDRRFQYHCSKAWSQYGRRPCQFIQGNDIDRVVVEEFWKALTPAEIDALQAVSARQAARHTELIAHLEQERVRLHYEAQRAERQYQCVDPENRLIAATLERRWEEALESLGRAESRLAETQAAGPTETLIRPELRRAFTDLGKQLPNAWTGLTVETRKALLRTLVAGVNLLRRADATLQVRIVWRGGLVTERVMRVRAFTLRDTDVERATIERIQELTAEGLNSDHVAERLNGEGHTPCRGQQFTGCIVTKLRRRFCIVSNLEKLRRGDGPKAYTVDDVARMLDVHSSWIYRRIKDERIRAPRDERYQCYLFPQESTTIDRMKQLKAGRIRQAVFPGVHHDG